LWEISRFRYREKSMPDMAPTPFETVREHEFEQIRRVRAKRRSSRIVPGQAAPTVNTGDIQPVGLAFSGGGIRSATFNLGVLQGLADLGLLPIFDYLSTVSGGGYIGSWLVSWIKRNGFAEVEDELRSDWVDRASSQEPREIRFLREYSNYLTPKLGAFSGDTWAFVGAYVRNLLLNQIILGLILIVLLLLSRPLLLYFWMIASGHVSGWAVAVAGALLLCVAIGATIANLSDQAKGPKVSADSTERLLAAPSQVALFVLFPILTGIWLLWAWWWAFRTREATGLQTNPLYIGLEAGVAFMILWLVGWIGGEFVRYLIRRLPAREEMSSGQSAERPLLRVGASNQPPPPQENRAQRFGEFLQSASQGAKRAGFHILPIILWSGVAAFIGGLLVVQLTEKLAIWNPSDPDQWHIAYRGFPLAVLIFLFVQVLHIGLAGGGFSEDAREWWGRLGGMIALITLCVTVVYVISFDGPWIVSGWLLGQNSHRVYAWLAAALWAAITGAGVSAGKNPLKPAGGLKVRPGLIAKISPPVFVLGLLLILSSVTQNMLYAMRSRVREIPRLLSLVHWFESYLGKWPTPKDNSYWGKNSATLDGSVWVCIIGFFVVAWLLSRRVGINRFSMHSLYRNRLVRCYLGASNGKRQPQPFTGIDPTDDSVLIQDLAENDYMGPYPIVNTALNLVNTENLAWQQRKSASFVFSPMYSGFEFPGPEGQIISALRPSAAFQIPLTMGLAMATSGAAASPNMGSHSTPSLSFLMTVFNVRLGWWFGNPRYSSTWGRMGPRFGLFYLINELMGHTNHENNYVYLSDGGHFENLGIYELVRRRCRFIVVCDAGEDHALHFGDLGNAIERCRTDFGIDVDIDIEPLRLQKDTGKSKWHCAIGTIHYEKVDLDAPAGTLVYIKSTLTGDEPTDVQRYADECPVFPHQSTADQWFTESQFESYRALGQHIVQSTFGAVGKRKELEKMDVEEIFVRMRQQWYPPSRFVQTSFTKHTATYTLLLEKMRTNDKLRFLDAQVYPEWPKLIGTRAEPARTSLWLPPDVDHKRAGFYFCNEVIQLMEDAYLDLNLEYEFDHPDNRGWINLFRHWSWSGMFCATWAISAGIYGARFQNFCERYLDLRPGKVKIRKPLVPWKQQFADLDEKSAFFSTLEDVYGLDFWEIELIKTFLARGRFRPEAKLTAAERAEKEAALNVLRIVPFKMIVEGLRGGPNILEFNVGFALILIPDGTDRTTDIWYFRIHDHMRKMGLAREALMQLMQEFGSRLRNDVLAAPVPTGLEELAEGASKWEAIPSLQAVQRFKNLFDSVRLGQSHRIGALTPDIREVKHGGDNIDADSVLRSS
jgi:hypothetical protein